MLAHWPKMVEKQHRSSSIDTMRLFRTAPAERPLTVMLRHMEHGRFAEAWRALKQDKQQLPAPPHALARLGRWLADRGEFKKAVLPLSRFLETYPNHQDRPVVQNDLAVCFKKLGKVKEAAKLVKDQ